MATFDPRAVGDTSTNVEPHSMTAALSAGIETLTAEDTVGNVPAKAVFESVIVISTLVRDEMMDDDAFVGLAMCCIEACYALRAVVGGRHVDGLSGPVKKAIESLEKTVRRIESKISEYALGANHHPGHTGAYPIMWKMEIQRILGTVGGNPELGDALMTNGIEQRVQKSPDTKQLVSISQVASGHNSPEPTGPSLALYPGERALQRLISCTIPQGERTPLIETICSSRSATDMVDYLRGSDAQIFIDALDEALENPNIAPQIRRKYLKLLYKACTGHTLLPRSLQIQLDDNPTGVALYRGGFGDVWKREYRGKNVAVKVVRTYANSDLRKITRRFCKEFVTWKALHHPNVLPLLGVIMSGTQLAMVSEWMPNGNINQFVKKHRNANRFELLRDVARGLIYMHSQGMVHGDLKGANILIDEAAHARLADFGLLAITSDAASRVSSSSIMQGGTYRWMSPELFYPENFGLKNSGPTKHSDCYALGMVVYEVLSGRVPFPRHNLCAVVAKVSRGERPGRPRGLERKWFTDDIWRMLQRCWTPKRDNRPRIEDVLRCLEKASRFWTPRMVAPPATNPSTRNSSCLNTEGSTESDSEARSTTRMVTSELSLFTRLAGEPAKTHASEYAEHDAEENVAGTRRELSDSLFERVDSASPPSSSRARPIPVANDSSAGPSLAVGESGDPPTPAQALDFSRQEYPTSPDDGKPPLGSSQILPKFPLPSSIYPVVPPKLTNTPPPAVSRGGKSLSSGPPWNYAGPTSQSDPSLKPTRGKTSTLLSTAVEPPSSSHEYDTDSSSSTTAPPVPPKPTSIPRFAMPKQRKGRKVSRSGLPRGSGRSTSPWQSDTSLQTPPGKSLTLLSTAVEPPSSSYGHDTPLQTPTAKSLALSSTHVEPPSSLHEFDTPSSSSISLLTLPKSTIPGAATLKQRRRRKSRRSGLLRDNAQPPSQWQNNILLQPLYAKSSALLSLAAEPSSSIHEYDTDSSFSIICPPVPPKPTIIPGVVIQGRETAWFLSSSSPSLKPQVLSEKKNIVEAISYGDTRGLSASGVHRGRYGSRLTTRTWKNWLRSSLGKLFGNHVTSP